MEKERLWYYAIHGSPVVQAMALVLIDEKLSGKISKLAKKILSSGD